MAKQRDITIESSLPVVSSNGLNTLVNIDFDSGSNSCALPASTTVGGAPISALGNITGSNTTGVTFSVTNTGVYTGVGADQVIANSATTGVVSLVQANGLTTGTGLSINSTGTITLAGSLLSLTANNATTTNGILQISGTGLTSGAGLLITGGGANMTSSGVLLNMNLGAATAGSGLDIVTTGVYTDTTGLLSIVANNATTGTLTVHSGTGITTGKIMSVVGTAATLTTGRYITVNDSTTEVFGIGTNGHIISGQTTAPTIAVTQQNGITAAAITAGSTDTAGTITTTGTNNNGGTTILTVTFNKTYTTAPKVVIVNEANNSAALASTFITSTATTFVLTILASATSGATPSWTYFVIA